jgi:hypothetical protein
MVRTTARIGAAVVAQCTVAVGVEIGGAGDLAGHTFEGWMGRAHWPFVAPRSGTAVWSPNTFAKRTGLRWFGPGGRAARDGFERLEFPLGKVLYQTSGYISDIRFSRRAIASRSPTIRSIRRCRSRRGRRQRGPPHDAVDGWVSVHGIAWSKDGSEIGLVERKGWRSIRMAYSP